MREVLTVLSMALATSLAAADDAGLKSIAGKWEVVSVTRDGAEDATLKGATRVHDGAKYTITPAAGSKSPVVAGALVVDASKTPVTIDMKPADGRYKDKTLQGILKLDGDTLTIAFAEPGKDRPASFESKPGSGVVVAVHKKAK
jgi:uncharacterized protein (TIGR03067 family)